MKIEVDHIIQRSKGGGNEPDNGIPVCFDCHAEIKHYNEEHPRGTRFTPAELRKHRDRMFQLIEDRGPAIFDLVSNRVVVLQESGRSHWPDVSQSNPASESTFDLHHEARIARFLRYVSEGEDLVRVGDFVQAIPRLLTAIQIAETATEIARYESGSRYPQARVRLWYCYLEIADKGSEEALRSAVSLGMDENEIGRIWRRGHMGGLNCQDYVYLALQEKLLLLNESTRSRCAPEQRARRFADLMDLAQDRGLLTIPVPHSAGLVSSAS